MIEIENLEKAFGEKVISVKGGMLMPESSVGVYDINPKTFFRDGRSNGYAYKADFLSMLYSVKKGELMTLNIIFKLMSEEAYFTVSCGQAYNDKRQSFIRCNYINDGIEYMYKVMTVNAMHHFFNLYQFSILKCQLSLESLYQEALIKSTN